ncbi:MAG: Maltodextrin ABC transporter, permease protein MdxF [uncultured Thermomicrobiales bacterium]|uniref:Maltodextrin ABC transporter, permease protein MdxF n=1 Tax=uncultured Thermomicrobiales bacterium TaxID=1645740 RepID=A0A6J4VWJ5_9BACT|nr:MAG: Maltodextrin ABC transporter, permease protein MdxF [uncultured Thermomicrobiales bacterium]
MSQPIAETQRATATEVSNQRRPGATQRQQQTRLAWLLLLPTLAIVVFVALYPLAQTIYQSFTDARLASGVAPKFIGLQNYSDLVRDLDFRRSILVTLQFTLLTVVFEFLLGLGIALVINSAFKGRGVVRTAMLVPWAIPTVVSAQMWKWMYSDQYGVINDFLGRIGLIDQPIAFIAQPNTSLAAIAAVDIWKTTPFVALLLLAGLQVIPGEVYEAARIDGANAFQQFLRITMPLLRPAILVTLIFRTLDSLRVFDVFYVMFGARQDTQTMAIYNQQNIVSFSDLGYGSAISVAIFLIIGIFVVAYVTFLKVEEA